MERLSGGAGLFVVVDWRTGRFRISGPTLANLSGQERESVAEAVRGAVRARLAMIRAGAGERRPVPRERRPAAA